MNSREKKPLNSPDSSCDIVIRDLDLTAGSRRLLVSADAEFRKGDITLIVGPSGVGKSLLLRLIAGLIETSNTAIESSGELLVGGKPRRSGQLGVVFQSFALFDEMSPRANVSFAKAHGGGAAKEIDIDALLSHLRVPTDVPASRLSGGQRQRLAIARTLAYNPPAILYDEPTSGLDPSTGRQVATLIQDTHNEYEKTSVIVTHDYQSLMPIADRLYLLDPDTKKLVDVPREEWEDIPKRLEPMSSVAIDEDERTESRSLKLRLIEGGSSFLRGTSRAVEATAIGLFSLIPTWRNVRWGLKSLWHYCRLVAGPAAWFYLLISGVIIGFVATYFTFRFLPYASYTEPLLIDDLLSALGFSLYRIFVPVLSTVLIAARCGAAVTSDVGGREYGNQNDALKTFGTTPRSYLLSPIMIAFVIGTPILTLLAFWAARIVSLISFVMTHPVHGPDFWSYHFHRALSYPDLMFFRGTAWLIAKLVCCGFGIAIISYFQGRRPKYSTTDVSRSVTSTILWATLFVLIVHFGFAFYEFEDVGQR